MNITPLNDRIVVRRESASDKTAGGIILPDNSKQKPHRGTILAVGPGKLNKKDGSRHPLQLKVGDKVLFTSWAGDEFKTNQPKDGDILIMHEDDVMAVIE